MVRCVSLFQIGTMTHEIINRSTIGINSFAHFNLCGRTVYAANIESVVREAWTVFALPEARVLGLKSMSSRSWIDDLVPSRPKLLEVRKRILVADDDPIFVSLVHSNLHGIISDFLSANNGADALDLLLSEPCDLAIVDLSMPQIDGFRLISYVRNTPRLTELPIAVVTAREDAEAVAESRRLGVQLFLTKPLNWRAFPYQISHVLRALDDRDIPATRSAIHGSATSLAGPAPSASNQKTGCEQRIGHDGHSVAPIVERS
ncbi:MAG: response regulator [Hyphomicrobiaceae bacterium]